jgi:hypothetical protein
MVLLPVFFLCKRSRKPHKHVRPASTGKCWNNAIIYLNNKLSLLFCYIKVTCSTLYGSLKKLNNSEMQSSGLNFWYPPMNRQWRWRTEKLQVGSVRFEHPASCHRRLFHRKQAWQRRVWGQSTK